MPATH